MGKESTLRPEETAESHVRPRRVPAETLLGSLKQVVIVHNGRDYHLRLTQNGKLILTA